MEPEPTLRDVLSGIGRLETRFDGLETRFDGLDEGLRHLHAATESHFVTIEGKLGNLAKDVNEIRIATAHLERRVDKLSEAVGLTG